MYHLKTHLQKQLGELGWGGLTREDPRKTVLSPSLDSKGGLD